MEGRSQAEGIIAIFNGLGHDVLEIRDSFYVVSSFDPATTTNVKHYLTGKDVTSFIEDNKAVQHLPGSEDQYKKGVVGILEKLTPVKKQFHHSFQYVLHQTSGR